MTADPPAVRVVALWVGDRGRPEFLATARPTVSWAVESEGTDWAQRSAQIEVRLDGVVTGFDLLGAGSQRQPWPARDLAAYESAAVRVWVRGTDGSASALSSWVEVRTGPLGGDDWRAPLITPAVAADAWPERGTARFRTELTAPAGLASAVLSVTAHGLYEATVGGVRVGDELLTPGWTAYRDRLAFQTHDVTALVRAAAADGDVVLAATVAEGWYGERFGFDGNFARAYPGPVALAAQLRLVDEAGAVTWVTTGPDWTTSVVGPVTSASIYQGESHDARLDDDAAAVPGVTLPAALPARLLADVLTDDDAADHLTAARLVPASSPPVRVIETLPVREVRTSGSGATILDFGQNLVGWVRLRVDGRAGTVITLRHAEVLEDGELGVRPLRFAKATDRYTLRGDGPEEWHPRFTFHGFRYVEVSGWPGAFDPADVTAEVVHSDLVRTGELTTSNPLLNQLHSNVRWGMRGNFVSLPTDCPQRDERLGWTGDIQVFAPTASYLYDTAGFLGSWLSDLTVEQARSGTVPIVVPNPLPFGSPPGAAWGDAATIVPDALYAHYADPEPLARQYASMRAWVEDLRAIAGDSNLWTGGFQFGDWLDPSAPPDKPNQARTHSDIVASAYYYRSTAALTRAAQVLGCEDDAHTYAALAEQIRLAFVAEYVTPAGRMMCDAHTAYALAIEFGLVTEPALRARLGANLAELVRAFGYRIGTGFVGTPLMTDALTRTGHADVAYRLLLEQGCPSWLYPVTMGATTIWERWDSMLPDGRINPGEMTSFNHYALGAVADWMHRAIGGIAPAEPGYATVAIAPVPGGGLTSAAASLDTGYGVVTVDWVVEGSAVEGTGVEGAAVQGDGSTFTLRASVPANTRALVTLPGADDAVEVGSGEHTWTCALPAPPAVDPAPWTLDTPLARFMDDDVARSALLAVLAEVGFFFAAGWTADGRWRSDTSLRQSLVMLSLDAIATIERTVAALG
ncbi:alpha-L-rhamnosidase [Pengzhenrongella frigida]|uniref:alpha-L-rhamnosidase n=1 Tax=Pengzhenrongella frigida TaxID=1259133 RepID=A0A4Q5N2H2_9MICO|nr:alpha-L-rhamnosidase [Cellulomonas sp. HLT2-17]RYV50787.1 alpha-L-rhamnosidase [Cellulomonas sp. HLT2-17]